MSLFCGRCCLACRRAFSATLPRRPPRPVCWRADLTTPHRPRGRRVPPPPTPRARGGRSPAVCHIAAPPPRARDQRRRRAGLTGRSHRDTRGRSRRAPPRRNGSRAPSDRGERRATRSHGAGWPARDAPAGDPVGDDRLRRCRSQTESIAAVRRAHWRKIPDRGFGRRPSRYASAAAWAFRPPPRAATARARSSSWSIPSWSPASRRSPPAPAGRAARAPAPFAGRGWPRRARSRSRRRPSRAPLADRPTQHPAGYP